MDEVGVNGAGRWLHAQHARLRDRDADASAHRLDRACAGLEALAAAGAVSPAGAAVWRARFNEAAEAGARASRAEDPAATGLLEELLAAVPPDPEWDDPAVERFDGAVELLGAVGAASPADWDARLREHTGRPSAEEELAEERALNAGGTQVELETVLLGPAEARGGFRLVLALRFADGMTFLLDQDGGPDHEWADWRLLDDSGAEYRAGSMGGSDSEETVSFRQAPPETAGWVELVHGHDPAIRFRVAL